MKTDKTNIGRRGDLNERQRANALRNCTKIGSTL